MNYKLKNGNKISSASVATVNVTIANTDLNDYTQDGVYYFGANYTPTNIPAGVNGWLQVMTGNQAGTICKKQIWYRHGTANSNDFETYVRTSTDGSTWSNWRKVLTELDFYYKSGDSVSFSQGLSFPAYITGGATDIKFTITLPKSVANISTINISAINLSVRNVSGAYVPSANYNFSSYATVTTKRDNTITITLHNGAGWNATNNTPISVMVESLSLVFN